jgi:hypothetical protein
MALHETIHFIYARTMLALLGTMWCSACATCVNQLGLFMPSLASKPSLMGVMTWASQAPFLDHIGVVRLTLKLVTATA